MVLGKTGPKIKQIVTKRAPVEYTLIRLEQWPKRRTSQPDSTAPKAPPKRSIALIFVAVARL